MDFSLAGLLVFVFPMLGLGGFLVGHALYRLLRDPTRTRRASVSVKEATKLYWTRW